MAKENILLWFFRIRNDDGVSYMLTDYDTDSHTKACRWLSDQYDANAIASVRRELTFSEYRGLLLCQKYTDVWEAMLGVFFRLP